MELVSPLLVNVIAVAAIIFGLILAAWFYISLYWMHSREVEEKLIDVSFPAELHEKLTGIPPTLVIFYAFIMLSLVVYVLYIWLGGISY